MDEPFECLTIDGNVAKGHAGGYLCVDGHGHPYPCHQTVFEQSYEAAE